MEGPHLLLFPAISNLPLTSICKGLQNVVELLGVKYVYILIFFFFFFSFFYL